MTLCIPFYTVAFKKTLEVVPITICNTISDFMSHVFLLFFDGEGHGFIFINHNFVRKIKELFQVVGLLNYHLLYFSKCQNEHSIMINVTTLFLKTSTGDFRLYYTSL